MSVKSTFLSLLLLFSFSTTAYTQDLILKETTQLFDLRGPEKLEFSIPTDLVVSRNGKTVYVLDGVHNSVKVFTSTGAFIKQLGGSGFKDDKFDTPVGIGIDFNDRVYVCDTNNARIVIFDKNGFIRDIALEYSDKLKKPRPVDIIIDDVRNRYYISDNANHKVLVYTHKGALIDSWGARGSGDNQFRYPATMAFNGKKLFVTDVLGTRVQIIDVDSGDFIGQIGKWGVLPGQFFRPKGVARSKDGLVYVTDSYMDLVQVFTEQGDFLYVLGDKNEIRRFTAPASLFIDKNKRLYVAETLANKIGVYQAP